jgi:F-type H+-transporting ATPase subunit b
MFLLADFNVIKPDFGLIFWTTIIFGLFWWLIGRFAFKPIAQALRERENEIQGALDESKRTREEMEKMRADNAQLLAEAREEKSKILNEAKLIKNEIISEARTKAKDEAQKIVTNAKIEIDNQKKAAILEVKNEVGNMALNIAEQVIRKELQGSKEHESFVNSLVKEIKLN